MGEQVKALEDFNKAIELKPDDYHTYFKRSLLYESLEQQDRALEDINKVFELKPEYASAIEYRCILFESMGSKP